MSDWFQHLFSMSAAEVLPLNEQAARGPAHAPQRSQFAHLVRHFLERFFNHETASPDGDAKARLVLIAFAAGLPGLMVAVYLWPIYHDYILYPPPHHPVAAGPPYWLTVNHHLFFVLYSFVTMGIMTVFEWDLFFPDLLDLFVLKTLPIPDRRLFLARVAAIAILIAGFLFDANMMATVVLPEAIEPPSVARLLAGHALAVAAGGLFAAAFIVAMQGLLLFLFGERLFRKISLLLQGLILAVLLLMLLLFPVYSAAIPVLLQSGGGAAFWFPPFWFLGIYQRLMQGPSALPIYARLAQTGCTAALCAIALAILAYPLAYRRRVHQLVEGAVSRSRPNWLARPSHRLLHATAVRPPVRRAVFHFIGQTLLRVPRYRVYLVLYGSVGLAVVAATVLRFAVSHGQVHTQISAIGIRAAIGIVPFWTIAGLRMAFVSSGNRQGNWIFRVVHGRPPEFRTALEQFEAARVWVMLWSGIVTLAAMLALCAIAPRGLYTWPAAAAQLLVAAGLCLVVTDAFFLSVTTVAFTGEPSREQPNLALTVLLYFIFFPPVITLSVVAQIWTARSVWHFAIAAVCFAAAHLALRLRHLGIVKEYCLNGGLEDGESGLPLNLRRFQGNYARS